jgi:guanine deaminase
VAESKDEVEWVADLFPWSRSYLDVYDRYGLLRERSVLAHCIHLDDRDRQRMADSGAAMSFCPTANLFLGSGLFDMETALGKAIRVGIGTDIGGGTSFSLLQTLNEAYKVARMRGQRLSPYRALYLATLGGAEALYLDDKIGNFAIGKEADFIVMDLDATPLLERRMHSTRDLSEKLFALIMLGDDRAVSATHILGYPAYSRRNT